MASKRWFDEHLKRGCRREGVLGRGERRMVTVLLFGKSVLLLFCSWIKEIGDFGVWDMCLFTFGDPQLAGSLERARGVFGEVFEDDRGGHGHGEGGVLVCFCFRWG